MPRPRLPAENGADPTKKDLGDLSPRQDELLVSVSGRLTWKPEPELVEVEEKDLEPETRPEGLQWHLEHIDSKLGQQAAALARVELLQEQMRCILVDRSNKGDSPMVDREFLETASAVSPIISRLSNVAPAYSIRQYPSTKSDGETYYSEAAAVRKIQKRRRSMSKEPGRSARSSGRAPAAGPAKLGSNLSEVLTPAVDRRSRLGRFVSSHYFDGIMGVVIVLNFVVIFMELEWRGFHVGYGIGLKSSSLGWDVAEDWFIHLEKGFTGLYLMEMLLRVYVTRGMFLWKADILNLCDSFVVIVSCADSFVLGPIVRAHGSSGGLSLVRGIIRILRAFRVVRFIRILRFMSRLSALRVLIKVLRMSMDSLFWSMVVLAFIILSAALLMVQLTAPFLDDEKQNSSQREWVYEHYGSALKASYTMFEATFSAKWATHVGRPLMDHISPWFSFFWVIYTVTVNFAVIRIIAALFLKQTMAVAAIDAEQKSLEKLREREATARKLAEIFRIGDTSGDGVLHETEFEEMMKNPDVLKMFDGLDLDQLDLYLLFDLLAADDGVADQEEFLCGAMKLQNHARTVDMMQVLHEQTVMKRSLEVLKDGLERLDEVLHPEDPWKARRDMGEFAFSISPGRNHGGMPSDPLIHWGLRQQ